MIAAEPSPSCGNHLEVRQRTRPCVAPPSPSTISQRAEVCPTSAGESLERIRIGRARLHQHSVIALQEAVRKLTALRAENLRLDNRGRLKENYFADVVAFDPAKIQASRQV